jgi:hypothetical protein
MDFCFGFLTMFEAYPVSFLKAMMDPLVCIPPYKERELHSGSLFWRLGSPSCIEFLMVYEEQMPFVRVDYSFLNFVLQVSLVFFLLLFKANDEYDMQ